MYQWGHENIISLKFDAMTESFDGECKVIDMTRGHATQGMNWNYYATQGHENIISLNIHAMIYREIKYRL